MAVQIYPRLCHRLQPFVQVWKLTFARAGSWCYPMFTGKRCRVLVRQLCFWVCILDVVFTGFSFALTIHSRWVSNKRLRKATKWKALWRTCARTWGSPREWTHLSSAVELRESGRMGAIGPAGERQRIRIWIIQHRTNIARTKKIVLTHFWDAYPRNSCKRFYFTPKRIKVSNCWFVNTLSRDMQTSDVEPRPCPSSLHNIIHKLRLLWKAFK